MKHILIILFTTTIISFGFSQNQNIDLKADDSSSFEFVTTEQSEKQVSYSVEGQLKDDTGEPLHFGSIALYRNGVLLDGMDADIDGLYKFKNLTPGYYSIEGSYVGHQTIRLSDVLVDRDITDLNIELKEGESINISPTICIYIPIINMDPNGSITTFYAEDIARQYKDQNNCWNFGFTIGPKKKEKRKRRKKKRRKTEKRKEAL